jgi:hypothetical protein
VATANLAKMLEKKTTHMMQPSLKSSSRENLRIKIVILVTLVRQVMLINAVKDVASALGELIQATKAASGKSINDPSMNHLKDSAKVCCLINISAWKR